MKIEFNSMITIWTSYFGNHKIPVELPKISIAFKTPKGFKGYEYLKLSPHYDWWKEWKYKKLSNEWYVQKYKETVLNNLTLFDVINDLCALTNSSEFCLLCYEKPTLNPNEWFCHRRIVKSWIEFQTKEHNIANVTTDEWPVNNGI